MTFVSYPNISATSENGRFRIEINGVPSNDHFRDQSNFTFRLFRYEQIVWEWSATGKEDDIGFLDDFPHEVWVNDDGWVVVRTHAWFYAGLMLFSPSGQIRLRRTHQRMSESDEPGFLDDQPEKFMGETSAGPFWARCSIAYFLQNNDGQFWVMRTWWGHRVVIDLNMADIVDETKIGEEAAVRLEKAWIQTVLKENMDGLEAADFDIRFEERPERFWSTWKPVCTAAYHAGWLQSIESIPELRRLEVLRSTGGSWYGPINWAEVVILPFRQMAKTSLLRMGQEPIWLSHYQFQLRSESSTPAHEGEQLLFEFPEQVNLRSPELLEIGVNQKETLSRIGAPDFIGRDFWEYDRLSSETSSTVRIYWEESQQKISTDEKNKVSIHQNLPRASRVEIVEPQWNQLSMRDHQIV